MRISNLLSEETITVKLNNTNKPDLIKELLSLAMKTGNIEDEEMAYKAVIDRENLMSTGLENGVAIPHAKSKCIKGLTMALGVSKEGIDFQSADGKLSHLFFFLLAPEAAAGPNIQVLAQIASLTNNLSFRETLIEATSSQDVLDIIRKAEE
jgi:PTS system fructose-specific IIC component